MRIFRVFLLFIILTSRLRSQEDVKDSLLSALRNYKHDTAKALTYLSIGEVIYLGDPDSAYNAWNTAKAICEKNLQNTLSPKVEKVFKRHLAVSLLNTGYILQDRGRIPEALNSFFKALKMIEVAGEKEGHANVNLSIGSVYAILKDTAKALKFYKASLEEYLSVGVQTGIAAAYNNIGSIYNDVGDFSKALFYYQKATRIEEEIGDLPGLGFAYNSLGSIFLQSDKLDSAMMYFTKAKKIQEETDNKQGLSFTFNNIGTTLFRQKKYKEAEQFYLKALEIGKEFNFPENIENAAHELTGLYRSQNNFRNAFLMQELYMRMRDTINSKEARRAGIQKQIQYEYEKKATTDSIRNAEAQLRENLKHDEEIKQQRIYTYGGVLGFVLMLVIALVSFRAFKTKQKANILITEQKSLVEEQKSMIEEKQKEIIDSIQYARRIQRSLLPTEKYIDKNLDRLQEKKN
jgi:tetratricopeptide (TPR) repeat protein